MSAAKAGIRVVVAMSGGVDSSVAAALLVEQGYDVVGMMMRLWSEETAAGTAQNRCCTPDQMADARRIAARLGIPFYVLDARDTFRNTIVQFFIDEHRGGVTPNPCIECNRHIRFRYLLENALALDARYLATGHYARVIQSPSGEYELHRARDEQKDQSYVLSVLNQHQLAHALFPIGEYTKPQVRELAVRYGLPTASKKDSQDLCFIGDRNYRRFLVEHAPEVMLPGPIVMRDGQVVGEHQGLANYTIGQRKGLGLSGPEPFYVIGVDSLANTLIVGPEAELGRRELTACRVNWISGEPPPSPFQAEVKIRYKAMPAPAWVEPLGSDRMRVVFERPLRDISAGQGAVVYADDRVLAGGVIERLERSGSADQ